MILCIGLSTALDITYRLPRLEPGVTNRIASVTERAGGKALNVARILHALGEPVEVLSPTGGATGDAVAAGLHAAGVTAHLVASGVPTRRTVALAEDDGRTTLLSEPAVLDCWPELLARATALIPRADVVVVSGSVPRGVPDDGLNVLVGLARAAGRLVVVDTSGPALRSVLTARPTMVKPNATELADLDGVDGVGALTDPSEYEAIVGRVAASSGVTVVASLGAEGLVAGRGSQLWRARPVRALTGNPTGAGDAVVAGLARGLRDGTELPDMLADCIALSGAAVLNPIAGEITQADYQRCHPAHG